MSDAGRVPLWMVATIGGLAAGGLLVLFFFGAFNIVWIYCLFIHAITFL